MQSYKLPLKFLECLGSPVRLRERRVAAARLAFPDDRRLSTRRGLLERLPFDRRGDRRGALRRAGMCVTNEVYQKNPKPYEKLVHHCGFET